MKKSSPNKPLTNQVEENPDSRSVPDSPVEAVECESNAAPSTFRPVMTEPQFAPRTFRDALRIFSFLRANVHLIDFACASARDGRPCPLVVRSPLDGEETALENAGLAIGRVEAALLDIAYLSVLESRDFTADELSTFFGACHLFGAINVAIEEDSRMEKCFFAPASRAGDFCS